VARLPGPTLPFRQDMSGGLTVDLDNGIRMIAPVDEWEMLSG
jgi:hypothetical protein